MAQEVEFDIRGSADHVIALLRQQCAREAITLLERHRHGQVLVVQEALDRYVAVGASEQLSALRGAGAVPTGASPLASTLERLESATGMPRLPGNGFHPGDVDEFNGLTEGQRYDIYASMVGTRGDVAASDALASNDRVILGLRRENSTLEAMDDPRTTRIDESRNKAGTGVYDDRVVVLWRGADGMPRVHEVNRANTEPTAQYDHQAGSNGHRRIGNGAIERVRIAASPGFEDVRKPLRRIEGIDADDDGLRDLGRLAEGTIEMRRATHPANAPRRPIVGRDEFALRPTDAAVAAGRDMVQRDTNADGWFTPADINGLEALNNTFKFHPGSTNNSDSAGCQTIHPAEYDDFTDALGWRSGQTNWQYVLTSTTPGMFRNVNQEVDPDGHRRQQEHQQPPRGREHAPEMPIQGGLRHSDPRDPHHPDHAAYQRTFERMRDANTRQGVGLDDVGLQQATLSLLARAKQDPLMQRIDEVHFSQATSRQPAGHLIAGYYRPFGDMEPAFGVRVETQAAARAPAEQTLQRLAGIDRQQAQEQGPQQVREREAMQRMV